MDEPDLPPILLPGQLAGQLENPAAARRIMISGPLDHQAALLVSAQLMTLDGASDEPVDVIINSPGGSLIDAFPILDVMGAMRAETTVTCIGQCLGTAAAVLAMGTGQRLAAPHASFSLRVDAIYDFEGSSDDLARQQAHLASQHDRYRQLFASRLNLEPATLASELERGAPFAVDRALQIGLISATTPRRKSTQDPARKETSP